MNAEMPNNLSSILSGMDPDGGADCPSTGECPYDPVERVNSLAAGVDTGGRGTEELLAAYEGRTGDLIGILEKMNSLTESVGSRRGVAGDAPLAGDDPGGNGGGDEDEDEEAFTFARGNEYPAAGLSFNGGRGSDESRVGRRRLHPFYDEDREAFADGDDHPVAGTFSWDNGDATEDSAASGGGDEGTKRYVLALALLTSYSAILAAVYLTVGNSTNSDVSATRTDLPIEEQAKPGISSYGYSHTMHSRNSPGWLSWPANADYEYGTDFLLFGAEDSVVSEADCAAKCSESDASAGSWNVGYGICWCSRAEAWSLCREPCVDGHTVDFARVSLHKLDYCKRSICDGGWYHSNDYCDLDVEFDKEECDAKIAALLASDAEDGGSLPMGSPPTPPPTSEEMSEQLADYEKDNAPLPTASPALSSAASLGDSHSTVLFIKSSALETAMKSRPDAVDGGREDLSVQNDDRVTYVRFDLPSFLGADATLKKATLNLYLVTQSENKSADTIIVDTMPNSGIWEQGSISWKDPPNSEGWFNVNLFSVVPLEPEDGNKRLYEVDVTSGISEGKDYVTFRLTTESDRRWYFASKGYRDSTAAPELLLTVAKKPTTGPAMPESAATAGPTQADDSAGPFLIELSAAQTAMKSHPDATWGGELELGVEKGNQISYLSFHLSPFLGEDDFVTSATLNIYSIASSDQDKGVVTVAIDTLPNSDDWTHGSISWNNSPDPEEGWIRVNTLSVSPSTPMMNKVDVTSAVSADDEWITFRLLMESDDKIYFASADWNKHEARPSLLVSIAASEPNRPVPTTSLATPVNSPVTSADMQASDSPRVFFIVPSAVQTTMSSHPESTLGGTEVLAVKRDGRISYLRFHLSSLGRGAVVTNATLNLRSIDTGGDEDAVTVFVDSLFNADDWTQGSISWNDPPDYDESTRTNTFSVLPLVSMMHKVDVTSAMNPEDEWITFMLSTESNTELYFASIEWNDGKDKPTLMVSVAYPPAVDPTTSPVPPTASPVPPTASPVPPTESPVPPTASPVTVSPVTSLTEDMEETEDLSELKYTPVPMQSPSTTEAEASAKLVTIKPSAVQTTMKGHPDAKWGGEEVLTIKKGNTSYIRFDLSSISGDDVKVTRAILDLYQVNSSKHLRTVVVDVDVLPDGGGWVHGSISWNNPPESDGWWNMDAFAAVPLTATDAVKQLHEVDVTSAINPSDKWITFMLSTEDAGELRIASEDWEGGEAVPDLHVTLSQ